MTSPQAQINQLREQQALITMGLTAMLEGRWLAADYGTDSLEAQLIALNPTWQGQLSPQQPLYEEPPAPPPDIGEPDLVWIGSPNYWHGHGGYSVCAIVVHTMAGTLEGCDSWFSNPASQVSSHYGIGLAGEQHQYVSLADSSWANGILEWGNQWPCGGGSSPNYRTITIETEDNGSGATPVTDAQYQATLEVANLAVRTYPSIGYLLTHHAISPSSRPQCCGDRWVASGRFQALADRLGLQAIA